MGRALLAALGAAMALFPDRILEWYERIAFENPEDAVAKPWIRTAIRSEGVGYLLLGVVGGGAYAWMIRLLGAAGAIAFAAPERYLDWGGGLAYERPSDLRWREGFITGVRVLGAVCVLLAVRAVRNGRKTDADGSAEGE